MTTIHVQHKILLLVLISTFVSSFTINTKYNVNIQIHPSVKLYGRKKGNLQDVDLSGTGTGMNTGKKKKNNKEIQVSSSLSQWAATQDFQSSTTSSPNTSSDNNDDDETSATTSATSNEQGFQPFENDTNNIQNNPKSKKQKQKRSSKSSSSTPSSSTSQQNNQRIQTILSSIQEIISSNNLNISSLLNLLSSLITLQEEQQSNNNFLQSLILNDKKRKITKLNTTSSSYNYNLAWVGSDDAICHIGTGLHKVPLARLQDIFMTLSSNSGGDVLNIPSGLLMGAGGVGSKNIKNSGMITVMEVIRILGPFPNVRNTLQGRISMSVITNTKKSNNAFGSSTDTNSSSGTTSGGKGDRVTITYESMMDGLGKEIKAGNDNNVRNVDLNILFADETAIVCTVPTSSDGKEGNSSTGSSGDDALFGKNGKNVLLFLKEDDLDGKLEGLRAA